MTNKKAFTIIELIVVIAIIAVLAAIIVSNVTQYNRKGKDAAIKGQVSQIRAAATDFFNSNGTYTGMCNMGTMCGKIENNISNLGGSIGDNFYYNTSGYCVSFYLSDGTSTWCVDNTNYVGPLGSADYCTDANFHPDCRH